MTCAMAIIEITYDAKCKHCHHLKAIKEGTRRLSGCMRNGEVTRSHGSGYDTVKQNRKACDRFLIAHAKIDRSHTGIEHYCEDHTAGRRFCKFQCIHCSGLSEPIIHEA